MGDSPWRAVIDNAPVQHGGHFTVSVVFFNDDVRMEPQNIDSDGTLANVTAQCVPIAAVLATGAVIAAQELKAGVELDLTPLPPPDIKPPTPEELAEAQYRTDRATLDLLLASQAALMPVDPQALASIRQRAQSEYLPSYDA